MFPEEYVKQMFRRNRDGAGVAYWDADKKAVVMRKGFMNLSDLLKYLGKIKNPEKIDLVLHCRIGTSGGNTKLNCHPYPLWEENRYLKGCFDTVMFHNGVLDNFGYSGELPGENDTQAFIRKCINKLPKNFLRNDAVCSLIERAIGYNKLVFLSKDGLTMIGKFIEEDGFFFSNTSYQAPVFPSYSRGFRQTMLFDDDEEYFSEIGA